MKKIIYEIIGIVLVSSLLGLIYNQFSAKPLPLIRKLPKVEFVSDSLVENIKKSAIENQVKGYESVKDTGKINPVNNKIKDTLIKPKSEDLALVEKQKLKDEHKVSENGFKFINYNQLKNYLNDPSFLIIDARNDIDYANGHIDNAINIDAYLMDQTEYFKQITTLPRDKILILYCSGGNCDASEKLAKDILSFGFKNVLVYYGGWEEWKSKMK